MSPQILGLALSIIALVGSIVYGTVVILDTRKSTRRHRLTAQLLRETATNFHDAHSGGLADEAITSENQDELNRLSFAQSIAMIAATRPVGATAFTIALDGEWGSGKSSVLNLVEYAARAEYPEEVLVVRFEPWEFSQSSEISNQLFIRIAVALLASATKSTTAKAKSALATVAQAYLRLAASLNPRMRQKHAKKLMATLLTELDLTWNGDDEDDRTFFRVALRRLSLASPYKILVIVDDVDRLLPREILEVFQVVKAIGDFPNIVYLLAMDHRIVTAAVRREVGLGDERYVEKVVQLPISLPVPRREAIDRMFFSRLETLKSSRFPIELSSPYFLEIYAALRSHLRTPRDVRRTLIGIEVLALRLGDEVNPVDIVSLGVLQTLYPDLYSVLPEYQDVLIGPPHIFFNTDRAAAEQGLERLLSYASPVRQGALRSLILNLFPYIGAALSYKGDVGEGPSESMRIVWRNQRRIAELAHFSVAFGIPTPTAVSHAEIAATFRRVDTERDLRNSLLQIAGSQRASAFLARLSEDLNSVPEDLLAALAYAIVDVGDSFPVGRDQAGLMDNATRIVRLVSDILNRLHEKRPIPLVELSDIVSAAFQSLYMPAYVLASLGAHYDDEADQVAVLPENRPAAEALAERIGAALLDGSLFTNPAITVRAGAVFLLARLKDWAGDDQARSMLQRALQSDSALYEFARTALSYGPGLDIADVRNTVADLVGIEYLYGRLSDLLSSSFGATLEEHDRALLSTLRDWYGNGLRER